MRCVCGCCTPPQRVQGLGAGRKASASRQSCARASSKDAYTFRIDRLHMCAARCGSRAFRTSTATTGRARGRAPKNALQPRSCPLAALARTVACHGLRRQTSLRHLRSASASRFGCHLRRVFLPKKFSFCLKKISFMGPENAVGEWARRRKGE